MKILLLSMPDSTPLFDLRRWRAPNLAMASLAGNITGHQVAIADLVLRREKVKEVVEELIRDYNPDVVGLSAMSFQFATARRVATFIKRLRKETITVLGGYHATLLFEEICTSEDSRPFDYILRGEGELAFGELLEVLEGKRGPDTVLGLSYRKGDGFTHNPRRPPEDLEKIKIPDRTKRLWGGNHFNGYVLDIIESSRGCTMPCTFCCMDKMYGKTFRPYSIPRVIDDIAHAKKQGLGHLIFSDDNFALDIKRFETLCDAIYEAGHNDMRYIIQASSTGIASSDTLVDKMARAGFKIVFLGIENISPENLKRLKKGNIVEKTRLAVKKLHDRNIMIVGGIILGNPEDKEEDIAGNYRFLKELDIDFYADQILTPYPKTPVREELHQMGLITNLNDFSRYNTFWANVKTKYLDSSQIQFLRWKYNRLYADNMLATKTFIKNHPFWYFCTAYLYRPYWRLKEYLSGNTRLSERECYLRDVKRAEDLNYFKDLCQEVA
ncbi:MAG TPA: B12-binding domain-containing radical SAM protein [Candidatus Tripitaka californicus]|uniref:B12-binding domain-containing radical SAM protein n=1 Tax=Candidatus Tripitaka californicus TaxID=3367616 RepID=UPI004027D39B|nr:B12-binding domain-containing radical SAM protein [Planctomycetota bacterium]